MPSNIKNFTDLVSKPSIMLQIPINYFLHQSIDSSLPAYIPLPNQPQSISVNRTSPHDVLYAIDGTRIFRTTYRSVYRIEISGRSGVSERIHTNRQGNAELIDPQIILQDTLIILDKLQNEHGKRFKVEDDHHHGVVAFHDFLNGITYNNVHVESFSWNKDVNSARHSYTWNLSLMAYDAFPTGEEVDGYTAFFNSITNGINALTASLDLYESYITTSKNLALNPIKKASTSLSRAGAGLRSLVGSGINAVSSIRVTLLDVQKGVRDALNGIVGSVKDVKGALSRLSNLEKEDLLLDDWGDVGDAFNYLSEGGGGGNGKSTPSLLEVGYALQEAEYQANILRGFVGVIEDLKPASSFLNGGSFLDKEGSYSVLSDKIYEGEKVGLEDEDTQVYLDYICKAGESLLHVAQSVYGDVSRWHEIAQANHWLDAHTTGEGYPARAGTRLRIPVDVFTPTLSLSPRLNNGHSSLLVDLQLLDGDLNFTGGEDLNMVQDVENIVQAIINRVNTELDELLLDQGYGVTSLIGAGLNDNLLTFIATEFAFQISSDERILSVNNVEAVIKGDQVNVALSVTPINSQTINLNIPLN
tara:strand:+ start:1746 stop:3503 length:1758 start_codon:yes stop_codon:yes gene_type:complete